MTDPHPLARPHGRGGAHGTVGGAVVRGGATTLVVDDEPQIRRVPRTPFAERGASAGGEDHAARRRRGRPSHEAVRAGPVTAGA